LRSVIAARMVAVGLALHPTKTKIVYCKDNNRRRSYEHESFTFLGFTFRTRSARDKHGVKFPSFLPAVSREALKAMGQNRCAGGEYTCTSAPISPTSHGG